MSRIELRDVTARDGLQDVEAIVPTAVKAELVRRIWGTGVRWVEATSFVSAARVPQLADAAQLCAMLVRDAPPDAVVSAFVATSRGAQRALDAGVGEISTAVPMTDGMSQANFGRTVQEMFGEVAAIRALAPDLPMSATVAVAFGCPYDGAVAPARVTDAVARLLDLGFGAVLLGDTIGVAHPGAVAELVGRLTEMAPEAVIGAHFHDARGAGVANVVAAVGAGATLVDAALGGLGGCPFAPGAAGNVAIEDAAWTLAAMGVDFDGRPAELADAALWMREHVGLALHSRLPQARRFEWERDAA